MHVFKTFSSAKNIGLIFLLVVIIVLMVAKNNQAIMRVMVSQEVALKTADFNQVETEHFFIKYTNADEEYMEVITEEAERAYDSVTDMFKQEPGNKTTLIIYPDTESLAQSFGWDKDEKAMGVYWAGSIRILSPRAWIEEKDIKERFASEGPMVHEFTHLMVDDATSGNYNRWWTEGIAQYVEKKLIGFEFADPFAKGADITYYDLASLGKNFDQLDQSIAYWESLQAVEYIVRRYGEDKLFSILEYLSQGYNLNKAIEKGLSVEYKVFEQDFYSELDKL